MSKRREEAASKERLAEEYLLSAAGEQGPEPRPGFKETAYHRIQARLEQPEKESHREARRSLGGSRRVRRAILIPVIALAMMVFFTAGAFALSVNASPDSNFYGTKLFFEGTRLTFTGSDEAKVDYQVELVNKRLDELEGMVSRGMGRGGAHWETAYNNNVNRLYEEIMTLSGGDGRQELLDVRGRPAGATGGDHGRPRSRGARGPVAPYRGSAELRNGRYPGHAQRCRQQGESDPEGGNGGENCPGGNGDGDNGGDGSDGSKGMNNGNGAE